MFAKKFIRGLTPQTQRVVSGNLFGYIALESGQYFVGDLWCQDEHAWQTLCQLTEVVRAHEVFQLRLGKATGRGYGLVSVQMNPVGASDGDLVRGSPLDQRIIDAAEPMTLTLLTDTILPDPWGRFYQTLDQEVLQDVLGPAFDHCINTFCQAVSVDHFNNHLGLPRSRDIAIQAGSAVGFRLRPDVDFAETLARLQRLETEGIGLRRHEGHGQVVFNHPVYHFRVDQTGPSVNLRDYPGLQLAHAADGMESDAIKHEFEFIHEMTHDTRFEAKYFQDERWHTVARWLHAHAHLPADVLVERLQAFGDAEVWGVSARTGKAGFAKDGSNGMTHIEERLGEVASQSATLRRLAVELLANRIAASAEKESRA